MMIGIVEQFERDVDEDGGHIENVQVDFGGSNKSTAAHFAPAGDDAPPLPDDGAICTESGEGSGGDAVVGYADTRNESKAAPGEKRTYARDASGTPVSEIWSKGDGSVDVHSLKSGARLLMKADGSIEFVSGSGPIVINGVSFENGNVSAPGEVTAMSNGPGVKLSTHLHPTATGPSGAPTPGS